MANKDLRDWLSAVDKIGELKRIAGAEPKEEIGGIVDLYQRKMGNAAVLFDEVPGFPKGSRVLANILTSVPRINVAVGLPADATEMDLVQWWRTYMREARSFDPVEVNGGPLIENVLEGRAVDLTKIPTPVWHEHDGGPFIGTACLVIMKDPDSGWVNSGTYRVQTQGPNLATVMMSPGKHGRILMQKYHERGQACPVAVVVGNHPVIFMLSGLEIPYGKSELAAVSSANPSRSCACRAPACPFRRTRKSHSRASSIRTTRCRKARSASGPVITPAAAARSLSSASRR
jgi:UbiD family decarboxylase